MNKQIKVGDILQSRCEGNLTGIVVGANSNILSVRWLNHPNIGFNTPPVHLSTPWISYNNEEWSIISL
jgi:hypothetical protein